MANRTPIYHITHINNLSTILKEGKLWSDAKRTNLGYTPESIAHEHIKKRRFTIPIKIGAKGVLADYVPFYFCNRSPMLCAIYKGGVTGNINTQFNIIYLVSAVEKVESEPGCHWCFSDGHAVDKLTEFYNDTKKLANIDWGLIADWYWNDTLDDNDRVRRKQAEFLVHESFPIKCVEKIGVFSQELKIRVEAILNEYSCNIPVEVKRNWYYSKRGQ